MANTDKPSGFKPVGYLSGAPWNGEMTVYYVPSTDGTAIFKGDLVGLAGSADDTGKYPTIQQYTAADTQSLGVAWAFSTVDPQIAADPSDLTQFYRPASTAMYVYVIDSPFVVYEIQEDSGGGSVAAASVGLNCEVIVGSGNTTTGLSAMELDTSEVATTATLPMQILRLVDREDNAIGTHAKWLVRLNTASLNHATGL